MSPEESPMDNAVEISNINDETSEFKKIESVDDNEKLEYEANVESRSFSTTEVISEYNMSNEIIKDDISPELNVSANSKALVSDTPAEKAEINEDDIAPELNHSINVDKITTTCIENNLSPTIVVDDYNSAKSSASNFENTPIRNILESIPLRKSKSTDLTESLHNNENNALKRPNTAPFIPNDKFITNDTSLVNNISLRFNYIKFRFELYLTISFIKI